MEKVYALQQMSHEEVQSQLLLHSDVNGGRLTNTSKTFDFSMVKLPAVDEDGYPVQRRSVTN